MGYRFRVYLPAAGIANANIYKGNTYQTSISSNGSASAKYDLSDVTTSMTVRDVSTASGYAFSRWIINIDGTTSYSSDERLDIPYDESYSNVQVRAEVVEATTYTVTLNYNANGGSGAPGSQTGTSTSEYVQLKISSATPTRDGYAFLGWALDDSSATSADKQPGDSITLWGSQSGESYTLYAVWQKTSGAVIYIHNGTSWGKYEPYIFNGTTWENYTPNVYSGGW